MTHRLWFNLDYIDYNRLSLIRWSSLVASLPFLFLPLLYLYEIHWVDWLIAWCFSPVENTIWYVNITMASRGLQTYGLSSVPRSLRITILPQLLWQDLGFFYRIQSFTPISRLSKGFHARLVIGRTHTFIRNTIFHESTERIRIFCLFWYTLKSQVENIY